MIRVDQTRFADGEGDCLVACIATVIGVPLEDIPHFCGADDDPEVWYPAFGAWLSERGYSPLSLSFEDEGAVAQHLEWAYRYGRSVPWIAGGNTSRGKHFVVYLGGVLFHDPNPNYGRSGLIKIHDATFLMRAAS